MLKIRADRLKLSDKEREKFDTDWAREHDGQFFGQYPAVPYSDDASDVLHLALNCFGAANIECIDRHLRREYTNEPELTALTSSIRDEVNARLKQSGVLVEFGTAKGKDVNGPKLRRMLLDNSLLFDVIVLMLPLYQLLESKKHESVVDHLSDELEGVREAAADLAAAMPLQPGEERAPARKGGRPAKGSKAKGCCKKGASEPKKGVAAAKKKKRHVTGLAGFDFAALAGDDSEDDGEAAPMEDEPTQSDPTPNASPEPAPPQPQAEVRPTYAQRVCTWYAALCVYFAFIHTDHGDTSDLLKTKKNVELAKKSYQLAVDVVRAGLACRGTDRKCSYDHDMLYGMPKLFLQMGKPQLAATEGSEHAHQEFKAFFKRMCSHNSKKTCDMLQFMNLHALKRHICNEHKDMLPPTKYSEMLSGMHLVDETTRKSKKAPRDRLAPIQDTTKVLEWGALHGFDVENEVLKALKSGSEGSEGD